MAFLAVLKDSNSCGDRDLNLARWQSFASGGSLEALGAGTALVLVSTAASSSRRSPWPTAVSVSQKDRVRAAGWGQWGHTARHRSGDSPGFMLLSGVCEERGTLVCS